MSEPLSKEVRDLVDRPNFIHLSTLLSDGSPSNTPVWAGREGDHILIASGEGSLNVKNARRDPRVAISIIDFNNPYEEVQLRGRVVEFRKDSDFTIMDAISHKYIGKPFPFRNPEGRVAMVIEWRRLVIPSCPSNIRRRSSAD
jgi:PPOX class probable F420-dependent enzyme